MTLTVMPAAVRADATALVVLTAPAHRTVLWSLEGPGVLDVLSDRTDAGGRAYARYTPVSAGDTAVVRASYGA